ncbi:hypothetical protein ALC56_11778, partial [Trachymyrmex septentrionalis]
ESNQIRFDSDLNRYDSNLNCPKISNLKKSNTNHIIYIPPSESMVYVTPGLQICVRSAVSAISSSFCLYPDLCLACPCPDHCHDLFPDLVFRAIWICADGRGRDRDLCPDRGPDLCLSRDPVDLCLGDRDLWIVNVNASDVCFSYERKILQLKRFTRNKTK